MLGKVVKQSAGAKNPAATANKTVAVFIMLKKFACLKRRAMLTLVAIRSAVWLILIDRL